jgi:tetratricopeptide (TPR) repeat protein
MAETATRWTRVSARLARGQRAYVALASVIGTGAYLAIGANAAFVAMVTALPAWLIARALAEKELARLPDYQAEAHARGDADALAAVRRIWTSLGAKGARSDALAKMLEGEELALREKWKEARDAFSAVDVAALPAAYALNVKNWVAYATAQAGDPLRALEIIDAAIASIAASDGASRPHLETTRARVLVLLGRPADALPFLEEAAKETVHDRALNQRLYWLGVANDGLGNDDAARQAYERAAALEGPCREKARKALASRTPFRG